MVSQVAANQRAAAVATAQRAIDIAHRRGAANLAHDIQARLDELQSDADSFSETVEP